MAEVEFVFLLPTVLLAYWLAPRRASAQNGVLLVASYAFYASWNLRLLPIFLATTAVDYGVGLYLGRTPRGKDSARRAALAASLAANLGTLGYFKYFGFFAQSLNDVCRAFGLPDALSVLTLTLPIGVSFYTLQRIGYVVDVYYGRTPACRSVLAFATFVAFFPQLVAGPIPRAAQMIPQFEAPRRPDAARFASGSAQFLLGFFMKAFVADSLGGKIVGPVFAQAGSFDVLSHWAALVGFAMQVFCDFAGYSFMALGVGRLLGLELPLNFDYPFLSSSLSEFWRRWHITLNTWLFDYVYGPLTTGRSFMRGRLDLAFILVFLISGLWHGPTWTFVAWGAVHGIGLVAQHRWDELYKGLCRRDRVWVARRRSRLYGAAAWTLTQSFFLLSLVPFRASSLADAAGFARSLLSSPGTESVLLDGRFVLLSSGLFVVAYHLLELAPLRRWREAFVALPAPVRGVAYGLVIVFLLLFAPVGAGTFIYAQF